MESGAAEAGRSRGRYHSSATRRETERRRRQPDVVAKIEVLRPPGRVGAGGEVREPGPKESRCCESGKSVQTKASEDHVACASYACLTIRHILMTP